MNLLEQQLDYPFGDTLPAPGATLEVAPGIKWIRMALPFALDHINLWLLRDEIDGRAGWTVVDCCIAKDEAKSQWEAIFASQLEGLPILRVIVTHMHPDHIGLAHWLCERWSTPAGPVDEPPQCAAQGRPEQAQPPRGGSAAHEVASVGALPSGPGPLGGQRPAQRRSVGAPWTCRLWISATDYNSARIGSQSTTGFGGDSAARFFASHGLTDPESVEKIRGRANYYPSMVPDVPRSFHRMMDGQRIRIGGRDWVCISGFGHAPEHIALYCPDIAWAAAEPGVTGRPAGVLISGDMVLPRISTNVSVYDMEPESNPLALFLQSLDKFRPLDTGTLTLPSHGKPFQGLHTRIDQLQDHHRDRLAEVMQACAASPCSAADILPVMFKRKLDLHQTTFAMGESVAHLHALWFEGHLRRTLDQDGIYRFYPA